MVSKWEWLRAIRSVSRVLVMGTRTDGRKAVRKLFIGFRLRGAGRNRTGE